MRFIFEVFFHVCPKKVPPRIGDALERPAISDAAKSCDCASCAKNARDKQRHTGTFQSQQIGGRSIVI